MRMRKEELAAMVRRYMKSNDDLRQSFEAFMDRLGDRLTSAEQTEILHLTALKSEAP